MARKLSSEQVFPESESSLTLKDLKDVLEMVTPVSSNWRRFGIALGVDVPTVDRINLDCRNSLDALTEVILEWLRGATAECSWDDLARALRSQSVREAKLAAEVTRKYCRQTPPLIPRTQLTKVHTRDMDSTTETGDVPPNEISEDFHYRFEDGLQMIQNRFGTLLSGTRESLKSQQIPARQVVTCALDLSYVTSNDKASVLSDHRNELMEADSIFDVFLALSPFWSFLNYDLLEHVITSCGLDPAAFYTYKEALEEFCKSLVVDHPASTFGSKNGVETKRDKLHIKIDLSHPTLKHVLNIRIKIAKILGVHTLGLFIQKIATGCVEVEFLVPQCITQQLFPLTDEQKHSLYHEAHVMRINCKDTELDLKMEFQSSNGTEADDVHCKKLDHDVDVIQHKFAVLLSNTSHSLTTRVNPKQLAECALDLAHTAVGKVAALTPVLLDHENALLQAKSIPEIFTLLAPFWSAINIELLQHIITELGSDKDKLNMNMYEKSLTKFSTWKTEEIHFPSLAAVDKGSRDVITLEIDFSMPTLQQILVFKLKIAEILSVHPSALFLQSVAERSAALLVPLCITQRILPLTLGEKHHLYCDVKVLTLKCNDHQEVICKPEAHLSVANSGKLGRGKYPSITLNNSGVAVEVHNKCPSSWAYLGYRVGRLQNREISWEKFRLYDRGTYARVAINDHNTVVEVHKSETRQKCFYRVGAVNEEELSIEWGESMCIDSGSTSSIALMPDGTVLLVYCRFHWVEEIVYRVGKVNELRKQIIWRNKNSEVLKANAKDPSVTIDRKGLAVITYQVASRPAELRYTIVQVDPATESLQKVCRSEKYDMGIFPQVTMTQDRYVVTVHQSVGSWKIWYRIGKVVQSGGQYSIQWKHKNSTKYDTGRYPTAAISGKRNIAKMHEAAVIGGGMVCTIATLVD